VLASAGQTAATLVPTSVGTRGQAVAETVIGNKVTLQYRGTDIHIIHNISWLIIFDVMKFDSCASCGH